MERTKPYVYGEMLTDAECASVLLRLTPEAAKRVPAPIIFEVLHQQIPNRLEHEVNKLRGIAFDSGENGFSHSIVEEPHEQGATEVQGEDRESQRRLR